MADGVLEPGTRLGNYQILAELGGGGMGRVYRAKNLTLERIVALKTLAPHLRHDEMIVQRFLKEARAAAKLNHPNIVQIYDFGREGDTYYLAMEYVEGSSLAGLLRDGPFPENEAVTIARLACRALASAHAMGLVHRDIKPDNLMLTESGDLKLVDLGVAKHVGEEASLTNTGQALGTPHYISPEQIRAAKDIDGRADLYSLGATLYHLVTGRTPFQGSSAAMVMSLHLYQPPDDPRTLAPTLSAGLTQVLRKLMAKEPAGRYADADAADRDLYLLELGQAPECGVAEPLAPAMATELEIDPDAQTSRRAIALGPTPAPASPSSAPTPAKGSGALGALTTEPNLKVLETELAKHVGPLARVLVKRAAKSAGSLQQLILELEREIPGAKPRSAFRAAVAKVR